MAALRGTSLGGTVVADARDEARAAYGAVRPWLEAHGGGSEAHFLWALRVVRAYAFGDAYLVPLADALNHVTGATSCVLVEEGEADGEAGGDSPSSSAKLKLVRNRPQWVQNPLNLIRYNLIKWSTEFTQSL